jgi:hypothetical protein
VQFHFCFPQVGFQFQVLTSRIFQKRPARSRRGFPAHSLLLLGKRAKKSGCKSVAKKELNRKFPQFIAPFPGGRAEFSDYGQNLQKSWIVTEKFPAKFPAPGNLKDPGFRADRSFFPPEFEHKRAVGRSNFWH